MKQRVFILQRADGAAIVLTDFRGLLDAISTELDGLSILDPDCSPVRITASGGLVDADFAISVEDWTPEQIAALPEFEGLRSS